jgi:hypothetical protein
MLTPSNTFYSHYESLPPYAPQLVCREAAIDDESVADHETCAGAA